jgi:ATP-dependent helicase/nuclease subunit A
MRRTKIFAKFNDSQRQALDTRRNLAVRANAGSGKTSVLVERIVQLLARRWDERNPLDLTRIVAITFTRKAAGELQDRLRASFLELAEAAKDSKERAYWAARIEEIPRAMIGTIDSFCARILREFGMFGPRRIEPDFDLLEDYEAELIQRDAVDRVINRLSSLPDGEKNGEMAAQAEACRWWAVNQGYDALTRHLTALLKEMVEPETIDAAHRERSDTRARAEAAWLDLPAVRKLRQDRSDLQTCLKSLRDHVMGLKDSNETLDEVRKAIPEVLGFLKRDEREASQNVLLWLKETLLTGEGKSKKKGLSPKATDQVGPLQDTWVPLLKDFDFDFEGEVAALEAADRLALLLGPVYAQYLDLCREEGRFDFLTIERWTRDLLAGSPQARKELKSRYLHVMVDEFQDTNHLQWEIISYLVGDGPTGGLEKDRLFIVGDPQQSIYRFRQAEVGVFKRVEEAIQTSNQQRDRGTSPTLFDDFSADRLTDEPRCLGVIRLRENYRSLKKIPLELMDRVFKHVFDPKVHDLDLQNNKFEVEYQELVAGVKSDAIGEVRYVIALDPEPEISEEEPADEEQEDNELGNPQVEAVVDQLVSLYGQPKYTAEKGEKETLTWKDMAVLLPSRSVVLTGLEKEFTRRGVPYVVTRGIGFWQRQEVRDIVSLASFLADSGDELSLFSLLRGPAGQLTDKQILFLSRLGLGRIHRGLRLIQSAGNSLAESSHSDEETRESWQAHWQKLGDPTRSVLNNYWEEISEKDRERFRSTATKVAGWRLRIDRMAHADMLQRCLEESGAYAIYAAEPEGKIILVNLERLFSRVRTEEGRSAPGLARLARWMRDQVDDSYKEEQATLTAGEDAVQIMTIHAAKGLEFPVVAIMKMERQSFGGPRKSLYVKSEWDNLLAEDAGQIGTVPPGTLAVSIRHPRRPREMFSSSVFKALRKLDRAQELAESRRLLYVAATRAKERLILAGKQPKQRKDGELKKLADCWQKWFEEALGLTEEDKKKGTWEDPAHGFQVRITTVVSGIEPAKAPVPALASEALHLGYLHEQSPFPTIAVTGLEQMRELWDRSRRDWWLRYRVELIPHVGDPPTDFMEHGFQEEKETIGAVVGTLVHRIFEMGGKILNQSAGDRERLLQSLAANLLSTSLDRDDSIRGKIPSLSSHQTVRVVVSVVQRIIERIKGSRDVGPLWRLLDADGEAEVDFILNLGRWRVSGRFDKLLPVGEGRFEIVDWKTDEDGDWQRIVERYRTQMKLYALALYRCGRAAVEEGRVRVHLALLHSVRVETVGFQPAELEAFARDLEADLKEMDSYVPGGLKD